MVMHVLACQAGEAGMDYLMRTFSISHKDDFLRQVLNLCPYLGEPEEE